MVRIVAAALVVLVGCRAEERRVVPGDAEFHDGGERDVPGDPEFGNIAGGDIAGGDIVEEPPVPVDGTTTSRTLGFQLYYRERLLRQLVALNRFAIAGDVGFGHAVANGAVARTGSSWDVVFGPADNNAIGKTTFGIWHAYLAVPERPVELTLLRLLRGLVFLEKVSGHAGLTAREALPGWNRTVANGSVTRERAGVSIGPVDPLGITLERELTDAFWSGTAFHYREDPADYYFATHPRLRLTKFALTFVFDELPSYLRISDCCSSWMVSQRGDWAGAYWGNHNSRDNWSDLALGYLVAMDAATHDGLSAETRLAAEQAAAAGRRIGDRVVADGNILMTVSEHHDYDTLVPGGQVRPDGMTESQDLGTLDQCGAAYLARAVSSDGLDLPLPEVELADTMENLAFRELLALLGVTGIATPVSTCASIDDAYVGMGWQQIATAEVLGVHWAEVAEAVAPIYPDLFPGLVSGSMDDFIELEQVIASLAHYATFTGKTALRGEVLQTLAAVLQIHRHLASLALEGGDTAKHRMRIAVLARAFGLEASDDELAGLGSAVTRMERLEGLLEIGDTSPLPLLSDAEIASEIEARKAELSTREPWVVARYEARFGDSPPIRRAGDAYEIVGADDQWHVMANVAHRPIGSFPNFLELALCNLAPDTVSCSWARLGCARADLNGDGAVGSADSELFAQARATFAGRSCNSANAWCDGADFDRSRAVDDDDAAYLSAAQSCRS